MKAFSPIGVLRHLFHSLQVRLGVAFVLAFLFSALVVALVVFYDNYQQSHRLQDQTLSQIAVHIDPTKPAVLMDDDNNDAHIYVQTKVGKPSHEVLKDIERLPSGFSTLGSVDDGYRIFVLDKHDGRVAVMQESEYRIELAMRAVASSLVPLLLWLFPLLSLLTFVIIRKNLSPIKKLSGSLENRAPKDLSALDTKGVPSEFVGFVVAMNGLLVRVDDAMRQQQRFIADAAHELRSPMTALSLQMERLASRLKSTDDRAEADEVLAVIRRNRHLLEQLLSLARAQAEGGVRHSTFTVQQLLSSVIESVYPLAQDKSIDLGLVGECSTKIKADEMSLFTLVKVFVDNAINHTPSGGQIDVSAKVADDVLTFFVEDSGIGIDDAQKVRVFDPFYRVLGSEVHGTGLGLSIAKSIADRYGGKIVLSDTQKFAQGLKVSACFELSKLADQTTDFL